MMYRKLEGHRYERDRHASHVTIGDAEYLPIIGEYSSNVNFSEGNLSNKINNACPYQPEPSFKSTCDCGLFEQNLDLKDRQELQKMLQQKEELLRVEYEELYKQELSFMKDKFDFILHNEQVRASFMLREAHRERKEKINALQAQLECKNLAGLMYVLCTERRKSKLERMRICEEYTKYIRALHDILEEGQAVILHLSRGYKTAARVDWEWKQKMAKVIKEFQSFVHHYWGGTPECHQYLFDLPKLMQVQASLKDDPAEDPCECDLEMGDEKTEAEAESEEWWSKLEGGCRPFIVYGDISQLKPVQRREVLKKVKAAKTAPVKWKGYMFNGMNLKNTCPNLEALIGEYPNQVQLPAPGSGAAWECYAGRTSSPNGHATSSVLSSRRITSASSELKAHMGSILKIITSTKNVSEQPTPNNLLLAARDSIEIQSSYLLREKSKRSSLKNTSQTMEDVKNIRGSVLLENQEEEEETEPGKPSSDVGDEEALENIARVGSTTTTDSIELQQARARPKSHEAPIFYEKVCPMEKCQRVTRDSFIKSLPPYMRASPFFHFEQTFDEYEACSPEQLEILMNRIEAKIRRDKEEPDVGTENPLSEWEAVGVATQTSQDMLEVPPCSCRMPSFNPSPISSGVQVYKMEDLLPMKEALDEITKEYFFDSSINKNRFKVVGQVSNENVDLGKKEEFPKNRLEEITRIWKKHPSLLDLFQNNTLC